jgi:DNA polymerase-1
MMKLYYDGKDLHDEVALELYGPGYSKDQRVRAKAFNFGLAYGRTPESIAEEHAFPIAEARALKTAWYARFPTAAAYIEWSRNTPSQGITQSTPFGRKRRFPFITRENIWNIENEAVNFPIQSTASDLTLLSAVELHNQVNSYAKILVLVHDSILFDVAQKDVSRLIPTALHVMQTLPGRYLKTDMPFVADMETGINWGNLDEYAEGVE